MFSISKATYKLLGSIEGLYVSVLIRFRQAAGYQRYAWITKLRNLPVHSNILTYISSISSNINILLNIIKHVKVCDLY